MESVRDESGLAGEDRARADCYALISRLFYAPPDAALLRSLADAPAAHTGEAPQPEALQDDPAHNAYTSAFRSLQDACRTADSGILRQEYDDLFAGAGRALVTPYTSAYALPHAPDRHLLALREYLSACGLGRRDSVFEFEDHVSAVCDVMRWLIERGRPLEAQLGFFNDFVYTGVGAFCDAIQTRGSASFYRSVAGVARAYLDIEKAAFDLHSQE